MDTPTPTEQYDLTFLNIKCGDEVQSYKWINGSAVIENYSCDQTSTETSLVETPGEHHLQFEFGNDVGFAHNDADGPGPNVEVAVSKSVTDGTPVVGQTISYNTFVANNDQNTVATNVVVVDDFGFGGVTPTGSFFTIPPGLPFNTGTGSGLSDFEI